MLTILTKDKCIEALKSETSVSARLTYTKKTEMVDKVISVIILCPRVKVTREVPRENIVSLMW